MASSARWQETSLVFLLFFVFVSSFLCLSFFFIAFSFFSFFFGLSVRLAAFCNATRASVFVVHSHCSQFHYRDFSARFLFCFFFFASLMCGMRHVHKASGLATLLAHKHTCTYTHTHAHCMCLQLSVALESR